jgi:hypothetical protein
MSALVHSKKSSYCHLGQFRAPRFRLKWPELEGTGLAMAEPENRRRSERVMLRMSVMILAEDEERHQIQVQAHTQVVNAHGGLLQLKSHLHLGQSFLLTNPRSGAEMSCRVVRTEDSGLDLYNVAFEFDRPAPKFWPVIFPPADWAVPVAK